MSLHGGQALRKPASRKTRSTCSDLTPISRLLTNRLRSRPFLAISPIAVFGFDCRLDAFAELAALVIVAVLAIPAAIDDERPAVSQRRTPAPCVGRRPWRAAICRAPARYGSHEIRDRAASF